MSILMTDSELAALREAALSLLIDTATIQRSVEVVEGLNRETTWEDVHTNVPCRVAELGESRGNREASQGGRMTSEGEHAVRFPYGTDISESDRIVVVIGEQQRTFEVARVIEHSYATSMTVVCSEVR